MVKKEQYIQTYLHIYNSLIERSWLILLLDNKDIINFGYKNTFFLNELIKFSRWYLSKDYRAE